MIRVRAILPKPMRVSVFDAVGIAETKAFAEDVKKDFQLTTATWTHKVTFKITVKHTPATVSASIGTADEIYGYVNNGTSPHIIRAKMARCWPSRSVDHPKPNRA